MTMTFGRMALANTAALALVGLFALAACSGGGYGGGTPTTPQPGSSEIHLGAASFSPGSLSVARGTAVRWINDTSAGHTITPNTAGQAGAWADHGISGQGTTFEFTFNTAGTYDYHCNIHAGMTGKITVN
jgi:plastocyanin